MSKLSDFSAMDVTLKGKGKDCLVPSQNNVSEFYCFIDLAIKTQPFSTWCCTTIIITQFKHMVYITISIA